MKDILLENDTSAFRNFGSSIALVLSTTLSAGLGAWLFSLGSSGFLSVAFFSLAIGVGFHAVAYHRSFSEGITTQKLLLRAILSGLLSTLVVAAVYALQQRFMH